MVKKCFLKVLVLKQWTGVSFRIKPVKLILWISGLLFRKNLMAHLHSPLYEAFERGEARGLAKNSKSTLRRSMQAG